MRCSPTKRSKCINVYETVSTIHYRNTGKPKPKSSKGTWVMSVYSLKTRIQASSYNSLVNNLEQCMSFKDETMKDHLPIRVNGQQIFSIHCGEVQGKGTVLLIYLIHRLGTEWARQKPVFDEFIYLVYLIFCSEIFYLENCLNLNIQIPHTSMN